MNYDGQKRAITAAILVELGKELEVKNITCPELHYGQVLVKILYSGICRSQLMEAKGGRGDDPWLPHLLGHEGSGIVIDVGEGVTKVRLGDSVILGWIKGAGIDAKNAIYYDGDTVINSGKVTTFSNYSVVSENRLVIKPKDLPFDLAVLFGCALPTGAGMVFNEIKPDRSSKVFVIGLGGIGISALLALKSMGVETIVAIDKSEDRLRIAKKIGVTHTFLSTDDEFIKNIINSIGAADYCIESGGTVESIELGYSLIRKFGGKLLFASHPPQGKKIQIEPHDLISGKEIAGTWGGAASPDIDIPRFYRQFLSSKIELRDFFSKQYKLAEINNAMRDMESGEVIRPLICMEH
ncbi:zinc-binding dehydrogenase [Polynucleobacter sp. MG-6-Vaara-E2]|uniref:zinc-binding dehydrogenase n=1 Tax=Polynucleobacter sp. MG-6-Vaara-E2 TaxID=2576932 RepID=UPI001BFD12BC|nr:zinc-binding dehydrogenase [Polynucleobacter sp. MG-6-Vaara-E2]QWD96912.1 zinc-binding dehydrogenase [Polynucleobacter sp. MG-6-Vaara-E2]